MVDAEQTDSVRIAGLLGRLAGNLEAAGHSKDSVADFLLRCSFTMFASSLGLLPPYALSVAATLDKVGVMWAAMVNVLGLAEANELFVDMSPLPLDEEAQALFREADGCRWKSVDLSIFGALVEGAFDAKQRHRLGAHYTPRTYVYRIVGPTIEEPLRKEWEIVFGLSRLSRELIAPHHTAEQSERWLQEFHTKLVSTRVLDPACGAGNFLIVALETLYQIEDEVLAEFEARGIELPADRVSPRTMLGIEINPRAVGICRLVLQLSHLRRRHSGGVAYEPALTACEGIECRDALLGYDAIESAHG